MAVCMGKTCENSIFREVRQCEVCNGNSGNSWWPKPSVFINLDFKDIVLMLYNKETSKYSRR